MKKKIKQFFTLLSIVAVFPLIAVVWLESKISRSEIFFQFIAQALSLVPGLPGSYIRNGFYIGTLKKCSWTLHIDFGSYFAHRNTVVHDHVNIGGFCIIGCVDIGSDVMIASRVSITSGKNLHKDDSGNVSRGLHNYSTVTIGDRTWIGEGSIVMEDVGSDSIVSAGSVVTKKAPAEITAVGNPARFIPNMKTEKSVEVIGERI